MVAFYDTLKRRTGKAIEGDDADSDMVGKSPGAERFTRLENKLKFDKRVVYRRCSGSQL